MTDRTLDVVFSRFISISFTITLWQKPKGIARSRLRTGSPLSCNSTRLEQLLYADYAIYTPIYSYIRYTPVDFCLRVIDEPNTYKS